MLPVIAGFFGVTVDKLLGLSGEAKKRRMGEYDDELRKITDRRERLELLRREHAEFPEQWDVVSDMVLEMTFIPECLDEMRKTVADGVRRCDDLLWRENIILHYIQAEPDEDVAEEFIHNNCSRYQMTKTNLLRLRYKAGGNWEKLERIKQKILRDELESSLFNITGSRGGREDSKKRCRTALDFISEISSNSDPCKPDMWVETRLKLLVNLADCCFALGENDEGCAALENALTLFENTFSLKDGTRLTYGTPILDCLSARTKRISGCYMMEFIYETPIANPEAVGNVSDDWERFTKKTMFSRTFTNPIINADGEGFARVKDDDRYRALVARLEEVKKTTPAK